MPPVKFIIHFAKKQFCNCFSDTDLLTNLKFAIREHYQILSVERLTQ